MKNTLVALCLVCSVNALADSTTLLKQAGGDIDVSTQIQTQKQLNLDNPFAIQLFSAWKALGAVDYSSGQWVELILDKQFEEALGLLPSIKEPKMASIKEASELYLLYRTGRVETFLNQWIEVASSSKFLQTELGLSLDQVVGNNSTQIILDNGFHISKMASDKLSKIESIPSKLNYSLQALKALRSKDNALTWIGKLPEQDALRMPLAQTALLSYAKAGKLGASGQILKTIVEPVLSKTNDSEELSLYFMTLARLLYQAGALAESKKYYDLIPDSSSYFLKAKTESLWVHLKEKDFSRTKGELATLEMKIFNDQFYPEAYLVSAMANVQLCQFVESRAAINRFVEVNRKWAKEIETNISNSNAKPIMINFYLTNLEKAKASLLKEKQSLLDAKLDNRYIAPIDGMVADIDSSVKKEIKAQWLNRKSVLETALYKMQFAKIELISRMRAISMNLKVASNDEVSEQSAAPVRSNQMSFPNDGMVWGDELFHMSAAVKNKCLKGELR